MAAQLDGRGEEGEHREEYGHLQQQRHTARHRIGAGLAVEGHGLLLTRHGILGTGIFLVDFLYLGGEDTHLRAADKALIRERENHYLDKDGITYT